MKALKLVALICACIILVAGCNSEQSQWKKAQEENTIVSYTEFLNAYPESTYSDAAKDSIENLTWENKVINLGFFGPQKIRTNRITGVSEIYGADGKWSPITIKENGNVNIPAGTKIMTH